MKKFLILIITLSFCLSGCGSPDKNMNETENQNNNYTAYRTVTLDNNNDNNTNNYYSNDNTNNTESEISSFSTKVYTPNDSARQNNIQITCSKLNETIVKSRRNFFFLRYCWQSYT